MSEHTPGPWIVEEHQWANSPRVYWKIRVLADRRHGIASVEPGGSQSGSWIKLEDAEANARLIAAAPDLLAALETLIEVAADIAAEQCESGENVSYWNRPSGGGWRAVTQARAAIKKSTGAHP